MNRLVFVNYVDVFLKKIKPQQKKLTKFSWALSVSLGTSRDLLGLLGLSWALLGSLELLHRETSKETCSNFCSRTF